MKRILKDYFTFSKKERTAVIILLLFMIAFIAMPWLYWANPAPPLLNKALVDFMAKSNDTSAKAGAENDSFSDRKEVNVKGPGVHELFVFDPNTISAEGWKRLGLKDRTIQTILNYRSKGGSFRQPGDLRKIWGLPEEDAVRLVPYVRIENRLINAYPPSKNSVKINTNNPRIIDVNTASAEEWQSLPGIGEVLANRILKYRDRVGGFTDVAQIRKTYGINDSLFRLMGPYLTTDRATIPKLDLNTASVYELKNRAHITEAVARAIVLYRQQYGPFTSIDDLKKIVFLKDSLFWQVAGFVKIE